MIHIDRPPAPTFLAANNSKWLIETEEAITHYDSGLEYAFKFKYYNDRILKDELEKVFVKCAYCESTYGAVYDGDVEHFRPKGSVDEKNPSTPGYYWMANDWENLYLSCQHCNQRRKHILYGGDKRVTRGKQDQFPLDKESKRMSNPNASFQEEEKVRLLIDPCRDDPKEHFEYENEHGVIVPLTKMGKTSVKVYALQRKKLVDERKKKLVVLLEQMGKVKYHLEKMNETIDNDARQEEFDKELGILLNWTGKDKTYAGMCRHFVAKFLKENGLG